MKRTKHITTLLIWLLAPALWAFQFQPITMDFKDQGPDSTQTFLCRNNTDQTIALQIQIFSRYINAEGEEILEPADDTFMVFPARIVMEPDQSQNLRVQYRGEQLFGYEQAYRIYVEQVPVEFDNQNSSGGLKILFRYIGSLYIVPDQLKQQLELQELRYTETDGKPELEILLKNSGTTHTLVQEITIILHGKEGSVTLTSDQLPDLHGINVLSRGEIRCRIPWPALFAEQTLTGELSFEGTR